MSMFGIRSTYDLWQAERYRFERSKNTNGFKGWRKAQYYAQNGRCAWCYGKIELSNRTDVDHIIPLYGGLGSNDFSNLVLSCRHCNRDLKGSSLYNEIAYRNTLATLSFSEKLMGWHPKKKYWQRPKWIKNNRYCNTKFDVVDIPEIRRNVWLYGRLPIERSFSGLTLSEWFHNLFM